jgi:hypothetical protein
MATGDWPVNYVAFGCLVCERWHYCGMAVLVALLLSHLAVDSFDGTDEIGYEAVDLARGTSFDETHGISEQTVL